MFNQNIQCKKILSLFLVLSGTAFLSGCVYHNYGSPHINGVITDQGQTLAGV
ncbi:carboxypeptidase regulatory-like domain-containing protein, partial [Yersinia pestis subsp. pestis]|nr:carboxypeptidase regulatory-like domain-containing protein [Yersinia pestis subsp. pestis]MDL1720705.1 carboxypeptidase regulatory-like domain-containing protein [Yersinia pestis]